MSNLPAFYKFLKENTAAYLATLPEEITYLTEGVPLNSGLFLLFYPSKKTHLTPVIITTPLLGWQVEKFFPSENYNSIVSESLLCGLTTFLRSSPRSHPATLYISDKNPIAFAKFLRRKLRGLCILKETDIVSELRIEKSHRELAIIRENQRFTRKVVEILVPEFIKKSILNKKRITEVDVRRVVLEYFARFDAEPAFDPIVAFGKNSSYPHHISNNTPLAPDGDVILVDAGCRRKNYNSDLTRTFLLGKMKYKAGEIFEIVKSAQKTAISLLRPGAKCAQVDAAARNFIKEKGYGGCFIHGLGHGLGLDVHENPTLNPTSTHTLKENSVVTVEPGIYLKGKFGIRIEDLIVVKKDGNCEIL